MTSYLKRHLLTAGPAVLMALLFGLALFHFLMPEMERRLFDKRRRTLQEVVRTAWHTIRACHDRCRAGEIDEARARALAGELIGRMRYGEEGKHYFWIHDMGPRMVMHPYCPELEGTDLKDYRDPEGKRLFVEMVTRVREKGEGFVEYRWQWQDDPGRIVPKISYVKGYAPWNWIIGSGIYLEDEKAEIGQVTGRLELILVVILGTCGLLLGLVILHAGRAERRRSEAEEEISRSNRRLAEIIRKLPLGVVITDPESHRIVEANPTLLAMLEAREEQVRGKRCFQVICPAEEGQCFVTDLGRRVDRYEMELVRGDGRRLPVMKTVIPIEFEGRHLLLETLLDISDRKEAERELNKRINEMAQSKRHLEILVSNTTEREMKMVSLKQEVNSLLREMGRPDRYTAPEEVQAISAGLGPGLGEGSGVE